jgi:hypothetical protein
MQHDSPRLLCALAMFRHRYVRSTQECAIRSNACGGVDHTDESLIFHPLIGITSATPHDAKSNFVFTYLVALGTIMTCAKVLLETTPLQRKHIAQGACSIRNMRI